MNTNELSVVCVCVSFMTMDLFISLYSYHFDVEVIYSLNFAVMCMYLMSLCMVCMGNTVSSKYTNWRRAYARFIP